MRRTRLFWRIFATYLVVDPSLRCDGRSTRLHRSSRLLPRPDGSGPAGACLACARDDRAAAGRSGRRRADPATVARLATASGPASRSSPPALPGAPLGAVLAESEAAPAELGNHSDKPEFKTAMQGAAGRAIRFSTTLGTGGDVRRRACRAERPSGGRSACGDADRHRRRRLADALRAHRTGRSLSSRSRQR